MKNNKSHFWYTKSQRNGILFLALLILIIQGVIMGFNSQSKPAIVTDNLLTIQLQHSIDSIKNARRNTAQQPRIFPFNPSYLTDKKGYQLGMSLEEIDRVLAHRAAGKFINSAQEFQQVSKVSDSLLQTIEPFFKFPAWLTEKKPTKVTSTPHTTSTNKESSIRPQVIADLNTVDATTLTSVRGIGKKLAQRIVNYRDKLGGFSTNDQLYEVYYLDSVVANSVLSKFKVLSIPQFEKIDLNSASFKDVLSIVYIDYELTKKIVDYRDEIAAYQTLDELKNIDGFPVDKFERIALYLRVK